MSKSSVAVTFVLFIILILVGLSGFGFAQTASGNNSTVEGNPSIDAFISDDTIRPGEEKELAVQLRNNGFVSENGPDAFETEVQTARNVVVSFDAGSDIDIRTGQIALSDISPGETVRTSVSISTKQEIEGTVDISVDTSYTYTNEITYNTTNDNRLDDSERETTETDNISLNAIDTARFSAESSGSGIPIGETGVVTIGVENIGSEDVTDASLSLQSSSSLVSFGQNQRVSVQIGDLDESEEKDFDLTVGFSESASRTDYNIQSTMSYIDESGQQRTANVQDLSLEPEQDTEIRFVDSETQAIVGGSGETEISLENEGQYDIYDATVRVSSDSSAISFGGSSGVTVVDVGEWDEDDDISFDVSTDISEDASVESYSISTRVIYQNRDDVENTESVNGVNLVPQSEQDVTTSIEGSDVAEGEEGIVSIRVENNGPKMIEETKISVSGSESVSFLQSSRNIGTIDEDESKISDIPVELPKGIDSTSQNIDITVGYDYDGSNGREVIQNLSSIEVQENKNLFNINAENNNIEQGQQRTVQVNIENSMTRSISNIDAEFSSSDPLSISQDTAFIESLESDEEGVINITVQASSGAIPNTYPLEVDFEYQDSDGTSKLSEVYSFPVEVSEAEDSSGGSPVVPLVGVLVLVVGISAIVYRFRNEIRQAIQ
jgi:hypothetical protein